MKKEFTIEEKIYNKILLLQANDEFMADVLALRNKCKEIPPEVVIMDDGEELYIFYEEGDAYKNDVIELRKKHNLSSLFQFHLNNYIAGNGLIGIHEIEDYNFLQHLKPILMPEIKPILYTDENGEDDVYFPSEIKDDDHKVMIEIFPETTIKDFVNNWDRISKQRDKLYGIKKEKEERFMKSKNIVRDLEIYNLKKQGKKSSEITKIINANDRFKNEKITYQEVSRIVKRLKDRSKKVTPHKKT